MRTIVRLILCGLAAGTVAAPPFPAPFSQNAGIAYAAAKKATAAKRPPGKTTPKEASRARLPYNAEEQAVASIPGIPDARVWGDSDVDFRRILPTASGPWLALSGGGADGAFGAGLMTGWTQSGRRPDFALVSGVSIGALIGTYAFLGSRYDDTLRENFTTITAADIFEDRPTVESLLDTWPLRRLIEQQVTAALVAEIAAEHRRGRRLLVATTNLDSGRRVIWNMGAIAAAGDEKSLKLFRDVLLASSSIPGFFAPVLIEAEANGRKIQELHLDGTVTAPFFVAPEAMLTAGSAALPTNQVYVVVNSKLTSDFALPERKTTSILARTISVALVTGLRAELLLVTTGAQRAGVSLNVAHVPDSFTVQNRGLFDQQYMRALFDLGAETAKNGALFGAAVSPAALELRTGAPH
jgi:predicted acylesterase/phospholipase RssA